MPGLGEFVAPVLAPGASAWAWAGFVVGWHRWRPVRVAWRLAVPNPEDAARLAAECRAAAAEGRRWGLMPRTAAADALTHAADFLDRFAAPPDYAALDAADALGRRIDALLAAARGWLPKRVAKLAPDLVAWFPPPPGGTPETFAALADHLAATLLAAPATPEVFEKLFADVAAGTELPDAARAAVERFLASPRPAGAEAWATAAAGLHPFGVANEVVLPLARLAYRLALHQSPTLAPPLDLRTLDLADGWSPRGARVRYALSPRPAGAVVAVDRFAVPPARPAVRVSLGPSPESPAVLAAALLDVFDPDGPHAALRDALAGLLEPLLGESRPPTADEAARVLDAATASDPPPPPAFLDTARAWVRAGGFELLLGDADEGTVRKPVFRRNVPAGEVIRVRTYGLARGGEVVRPAELAVSAGPPPLGFTDLEASAAHCPGPEGEALREGLAGLRAAGAGGYLELAAVDVFTLFWDHTHAAWAEVNLDAANAFAGGCQEMLKVTFGLTTFAPLRYDEYPPGWVLTPPGTRMTTGTVTRVLRPGLTAGGELRLPARVLAE